MKGLNDAEVQKFWQLYAEMVRRRQQETPRSALAFNPGRMHWFKQKRLALTFRLGQGRAEAATASMHASRANVRGRDSEKCGLRFSGSTDLASTILEISGGADDLRILRIHK